MIKALAGIDLIKPVILVLEGERTSMVLIAAPSQKVRINPKVWTKISNSSGPSWSLNGSRLLLKP